MPSGNRDRIFEIEFRDVEEMPLGVRRSVDVRQSMRKRPVEGKSADHFSIAA